MPINKMKLFKSKKGLSGNMHVIVGLSILFILWYINSIYKWTALPDNTQFYVQLIIIVIIWSRLPDIDQPNSTIDRYFTLFLGAVIILAFLSYIETIYGIIAAIIMIRLKFVGHRQIVHSVFFGLIVSLPLAYFFGAIHFIVGMAAYISHLIADNDFSWGWERDINLRLWK